MKCMLDSCGLKSVRQPTSKSLRSSINSEGKWPLNIAALRRQCAVVCTVAVELGIYVYEDEEFGNILWSEPLSRINSLLSKACGSSCTPDISGLEMNDSSDEWHGWCVTTGEPNAQSETGTTLGALVSLKYLACVGFGWKHFSYKIGNWSVANSVTTLFSV